jgi:hypothetical protein
MKRGGAISSIAFIAVLALAVLASATVPATINYQGYLKNSDGTPVSTAVHLTFSIYSSNPSRNNPLWRDMKSITPVSGVYSVVLGTTKPITAAFDTPCWLGVQVEAEPEMTPLQPLTAVPYAFRAATADSVGTAALAEGSVTTLKLAAGAVTDANITGPISATKLDLSTVVKKVGDTMTGGLNLPSNGLAVGVNQLLLTGGNVGIGTSTPTRKLSVKGDFEVKAIQYLYVPGNSVNGSLSPRCSCDTTYSYNCSTFLQDWDQGATCYDWYSYEQWVSTGFGGYYQTIYMSIPYTRTLATPSLTVDTTGVRLGGVAQKVRIAGTGLSLKDETGNSPGAVYFENSTGSIYGRVWSNSEGLHLGNADNSYLINLDNNGRVGIGTSSPTVALDVAGDIKMSGNLIGRTQVQATNPYTTGLVIQGTTEQSANLQEWQNDTGTAVAAVSPVGDLTVTGNLLLKRNDTNHGLGWYGSSKPFAATFQPDGPVLFGYAGGGLGTTNGGQKLAFSWESGGNSRLNDNTLYLRGNNGDNAHGLGWFNSLTKPFMGTTFADGPVLFGAGGGALGTWGSPGRIALSWSNNGSVSIPGSLSKGSGSFKIDHPLDPQNKYLYHSFVESPDMMNIYNGNVITDAEGFATVELPAWFEALNRNFRYQLTVVGKEAWARARIYEEVAGNRFVIQTDVPSIKVSWQVTGVRKDAYAEAHRISVEEEKPAAEKGTCLHPEACLGQ